MKIDNDHIFMYLKIKSNEMGISNGYTIRENMPINQNSDTILAYREKPTGQYMTPQLAT